MIFLAVTPDFLAPSKQQLVIWTIKDSFNIITNNSVQWRKMKILYQETKSPAQNQQEPPPVIKTQDPRNINIQYPRVKIEASPELMLYNISIEIMPRIWIEASSCIDCKIVKKNSALLIFLFMHLVRKVAYRPRASNHYRSTVL